MNVHSKAVAAGALLATSVLVGSTMTMLIKANEDGKRGPITLMFAMQDSIGDDKMAEFPLPDSVEGEGVNNYDKYDIYGDGGKVQHKSFYKDLALSFGAGQAAQHALDQLALAAANSADLEPEYAHYKAFSKSDIASEKKLHQNRRDASVNLLKRSFALYFMIGGINSLPGCEAGYIERINKETGVKEVVNSAMCLIVKDTAVDNGRIKEFTPSGLLTLKPHLVRGIEAGKAWDALIDTGGKSATTPDGKGKVEVTGKTFDDYVAALANFVDDDKGNKAVIKALSEADSDDLLLSCDALRDALDGVLGAHEQRIKRLRNDRAAA